MSGLSAGRGMPVMREQVGRGGRLMDGGASVLSRAIGAHSDAHSMTTGVPRGAAKIGYTGKVKSAGGSRKRGAPRMGGNTIKAY